MTQTMDSPERPPVRKLGRLSRVVMHLLMRRATITASEPLGDLYRLITLAGLARKKWRANF